MYVSLTAVFLWLPVLILRFISGCALPSYFYRCILGYSGLKNFFKLFQKTLYKSADIVYILTQKKRQIFWHFRLNSHYFFTERMCERQLLCMQCRP